MKKDKKQCLICSYSWIPKKDNPIECPDCKSREWNKKKGEKGGNK